jgi:hypothetical protein
MELPSQNLIDNFGDLRQFIMRPLFVEATIAIGLAILMVSAWFPAAPALIGMALVTLGATAATISRLARHPAADLLLAGHLLLYGSLYFLFVGAQCHAITAGTQPGDALWRSMDLAASLWPMAFAFRLTLRAILGSRQRGEDATRP